MTVLGTIGAQIDVWESVRSDAVEQIAGLAVEHASARSLPRRTRMRGPCIGAATVTGCYVLGMFAEGGRDMLDGTEASTESTSTTTSSKLSRHSLSELSPTTVTPTPISLGCPAARPVHRLRSHVRGGRFLRRPHLRSP